MEYRLSNRTTKFDVLANSSNELLFSEGEVTLWGIVGDIGDRGPEFDGNMGKLGCEEAILDEL